MIVIVDARFREAVWRELRPGASHRLGACPLAPGEAQLDAPLARSGRRRP